MHQDNFVMKLKQIVSYKRRWGSNLPTHEAFDDFLLSKALVTNGTSAI